MSCLNNTILTKEIRPHAAPRNFSFNSIMMIKCEDYQLMQKCDEDMYNHYYVAKEPIPKNATTTFVMISLTPMILQVEKKK